MKIECGLFSSSVEMNMEEMAQYAKEKTILARKREKNAPICQWCNEKMSWWEDIDSTGYMLCGYKCFNKNCHSHYFKKYIYRPLRDIVKNIIKK